MYGVIGLIACVCLFQGYMYVRQQRLHAEHIEKLLELSRETGRHHQANYAEWSRERQQLLDRIQAGSFAEYKTQEVRVLKAQTVEKEMPKLEQL